jgi:hypothetical protein
MSFHPKFVFNSIPYSQILRTLRNNSEQEMKITETEQCLKTFENCGYNRQELLKWKQKAIENTSCHNNPKNEARDTLVFPVHYFDGITEFKAAVQSLNDELEELIGDTKILFAMKKGSSLGNTLIRNKQPSICEVNLSENQRCNANGCLQCPLINEITKFRINGHTVQAPRQHNCKTKNIVYMWICNLCGEKEVYFGRTTQECHNRTNGHRGCFNDEKWENSALSMHAKDVHQMRFSLDIFSISVIKKVSPQRLRREEFKYIDKYRTNSLGLNRYR